MILTREEQGILDGRRGRTLQKVMRTLVHYGRALDAERLVDIEGNGHFSCPLALPGIGPRLEMLEELVAAGLRTKLPFTLDPRAPLDFENLALNKAQERSLEQMYRDQARYDELMLQLGLRDQDSYTCTPYLPEVGNIPAKGTVLAWSESSCVVYANSVLAARTNRNAAILDLLSNIVGKTPLVGLLTDEGRRATWLIEVRTSTLPNPQLLGAAIGRQVLTGVPFIIGLDRFLGTALDESVRDYLKEFGAAAAAIGAVGLFHMQGITPEAIEQGTKLLEPGFETVIITDALLSNLLHSYPVLWPEKDTRRPRKCLVGCPHLSLEELYSWTDRIWSALRTHGQKGVKVPTILCAAPQVLAKFRSDEEACSRLLGTGVRLSATCPEGYMDNALCASEPVITNSNKLRAFSTARLFLDDDLVEIVVTGRIKESVQ